MNGPWKNGIMQSRHTSDMQSGHDGKPDGIGVVIVTYNSSDIIEDCLNSLLASDHPNLRVVICDNQSPDDTVEVIRRWADAQSCDFAEWAVEEEGLPQPDTLPKVTLLKSACNKGFAAGTNMGIRTFLPYPEIGLFWVLNPDCIVTESTASAYARAAAEAASFSLMGGRILYLEPPNYIQSDGGKVSRWTGICSNMNQGLLPDAITPPSCGSLDFISGANLVASRNFIETTGLMTEDYFLYYEEVDWAMRRGDLPLAFCPEALVYHHGGTSIGTGSTSRRASSFANYFNYRNRMIFMYRKFPAALPFSYSYSMLKITKLMLQGAWSEAHGAFRGLHQLAPPLEVCERLSPDVNAMALNKKSKT